MILRAPSVPLVTVDPFFSVWSDANTLNEKDTVHWTGKPFTLCGSITIDGESYTFMGGSGNKLEQVGLDITALTSVYTFEGAGIRLTATFFTPLFPDDLAIMTRPVSYLKLDAVSIDGVKHYLKAYVCASEELCLNEKGQSPVVTETLEADGVNMVKMGNAEQKVLNRSGDDHRIDWGYFYLAAKDAKADAWKCEDTGMMFVSIEKEFEASALIALAYDDIASIDYFGDHLKSVWNNGGKTIETAISEALSDYDALIVKAKALDDKLFFDAVKAGGEKYAEMLQLAFRQVIAAHKCVVDTEGQLLFISKECFSNGCAATVDVSYPSIPMFLIYNPELVLGMMRPIIKFARSDAWEYDFAPHDAGRYPLVTGQVYGLKEGKLLFEKQMPVEECGNMLLMTATYSIAADNYDFARDNMDIFTQWTKYLIEFGVDPENQLCTDDFAGHLAHNCNLSLKAIMGIAGMSILCEKLGMAAKAKDYMDKAREIAIKWLLRASNGDGSYRLAFDRKGTFSMKYNIVWDKLFGTDLIPHEVWDGETWANRRHFGAYGMPLDNRSTYTKSDWMVWTATLCDSKADFESYIAPLWEAYNVMPTRVPMTDWYFTDTSAKRGFQNRTVQGGLYIKLLEYYGTVKVR